MADDIMQAVHDVRCQRLVDKDRRGTLRVGDVCWIL